MHPGQASTPATPLRLIIRALARRCPRCGGPGIFRSYLRLRARCASCQHEFAAEEVALGAPLVFYPFAAATWVAVELIMEPARALNVSRRPGGGA